jgi:hypothetical protein
MSHVKKFDTRTDDCNTQRGKTCSQSIVGELHLTALVKFRQMNRAMTKILTHTRMIIIRSMVKHAVIVLLASCI